MLNNKIYSQNIKNGIYISYVRIAYQYLSENYTKPFYIQYHLFIMLRHIAKLSNTFKFANEVQKTSKAASTSASSLTYYKDGQIATRNAIVLKKTQDIEAYVIKTIQNYFRTTYKKGLTAESNLADHGLDSLDTIELCMQIEEDLGYVISAETLPQFTKVKHFTTYIEQVEAFKRQNNKAPLP